VSIAPARPEALLESAEPVRAFPHARQQKSAAPALSILSDGDMLRWRYGERLEDLIAETCRRNADRVAVSLDGRDISYAEFDARANQMARWLRKLGVGPGDRVGVLLDRGLDSYVTLFGLMKARAAYVPIDANHPADRLAYILEDSRARLVLTNQRFADRFAPDVRLVVLDRARYEIAELDDAPLGEDENPAGADTLCYVLYTSGTTGRPKGVAVAHPSICNFVRVAAESYGFGPGDRVYQGMSIAFDFSIEELWVPLVAGATLVPNASANSLFGEELAEFLETRKVTCLCCVPTLLASIERELPRLRVLLIGGEACPPALVKRWSRTGRELLNSYGPTEATVTATLGRMRPDAAVTIGRPLPTYSIVILDSLRGEALELGQSGEIGIAGIGVAEGYLNRPEMTAAKFIPDFLRLPNNPSGRIYRTGDLGRINGDGEIEYLGRIDTQVKLRGYRIELTEIESVLLEVETVAQVAVATFEPVPGAPELVAYYSVKHGAAAPAPADILAHLRSRLPAYMTPAYLERLPFLPMLVSNKADRARLPAPKSPPIRISATHAEPETGLQRLLCEALKSALALDAVSIDGDFFKDYGAHSLLMARFCARIRHCAPLLQIAMRDIYAHTNVRRLAAALESQKPAVETYVEPHAEASSRRAYALTGAAQLAFYVVGGLCGVAALQASFAYTVAVAHSPPALLGRAELVVAVWFFGLNLLAIAAKWTLIGRAKPGAIKLWSPAYFRFWVARRLITIAPAFLFAGEPLFNLFLRCLGAKIGARAVIATATVPVAADLFEVGEDAVIARRALAPGYGATGQALHFAAIRVGKGAYVGEASVLDIDTALGDFAQLGHASSLQRGQRVSDGKRYHGSPAEETTTNFRLVDELTTGPWRRAFFTIGQLVLALVLLGPVADAALTWALAGWVADADVAGFAAHPATTALDLLPLAFGVAAGLFVLSLASGMAAIYAVPRLANLFLREGRPYRLYGVHHFLQRIVQAIANAPFFQLLFGDSVFIERYLRWMGVKLAPSRSTGSNYGTEQAFENPFFCEIGAGTVASDGLTFGNVRLSSHAFQIATARVGANSFLGTDVFVPPGARLGDNCLLGTKVMAPIDGPLRENIGLLGSPAFEIPRAATRDLELLARLDETERRRRLELKTRHNVATALMMLGKTFLESFVGLYVLTLTAEIWGWRSLWAMSAALAFVAFAFLGFDIWLERAAYGFRRMKPMVATSYDRAFWEIERYWKLSGAGSHTTHFAGTPFRPMVLRLVGAKIGRCVYDDGANMSERTLVEIGDGAALNQGVMLQSHSLEEGAYKSDFIRIGAGASLGVGSFVHYGVTMGERTRLDPDAFLMKGEITPADSRWRGNPARLVGRRAIEPLAVAAE
jgi:non-ribosomal peptide synthetase-like protein